jgi:hypothetical protein
MRHAKSWLTVGVVSCASALLVTLGVTGNVAQEPVRAPTVVELPRTADGKVDLSGIWQAMNTADWNIEAHHAEKDMPGGLGIVVDGEIPYQAWAVEKRRQNFSNRATGDPASKCYLPGVPRAMYTPFPFQIFQTPNQLTILFEYVHAVRNIYLNSPHPEGPLEWWMGDSRATWEGDTLVVDVRHFNADTWFDRVGNFHSEALHVIERYALLTPDHMRYEAILEDPKVFTRPWQISMTLYRHKEPNFQLLDYECYRWDDEGLATATDLQQ